MTRQDLPVAAQAVQASHAALAFAVDHPAATADWRDSSEVLVLLAVPGELELNRLEQNAAEAGYAYSAFREPDLGDALTAVALEPRARRLTRDICLAFPPDDRGEVRT